jgi:hypothetical protein
MTPRKLLINHLNPSSLLQRGWILILLVVGGFAFSPQTRAACDSPDPGCPGANLAEGFLALGSLTTGIYNTGIGTYALTSLTDGRLCTGVGAGALFSNTGNTNTAVGAGALFSNSTAGFNTAVGAFALFSNDTGASNNALGDNALVANTTGLLNVAVGSSALNQNTTGTGNIALGFFGGTNVIAANNVTAIGLPGADVSGTTWIRGIFGVTTQSGTTAPVIVSDTGQLGTVASSERFKKDIATMEKASEAILSLRPVTFHYKTDTKGTPQFGLIAEEVARVNPALVIPDKEGKPYTVRYDAVNAMLLNEFLKEHKKVQDLEATVAQQQKGMEVLTAQLKEHAAQIQKVSAQLELNKPAPQTVTNK